MATNTGGGLPPMPTPTTPATPTAAPNYSSLQGYNFASTPYPFENRDYNQMIQDSVNYFTDPNSTLMQQAKQAGLETAAERGGINSSIAAGAAQRASLTQAQGLAQTAVQSRLSQEQYKLDQWQQQQGFNQEMAAMPYKNSMDMLAFVSQAALANPQLYTPSVISGFNNFFNQNMNDILKQYFGTPTGP